MEYLGNDSQQIHLDLHFSESEITQENGFIKCLQIMSDTMKALHVKQPFGILP